MALPVDLEEREINGREGGREGGRETEGGREREGGREGGERERDISSLSPHRRGCHEDPPNSGR